MTLGIFLTFAVLGATPMTTPNISVAALGPGEEIVIDYNERGCFHGTYETVVISADRFSVDGIGSVALLPHEKSGLDRYFNAVREADGEGMCTTQVQMTLTLKKGGENIQTQNLLDGTCRGGFGRQSVTVASVYWRLKETVRPGD